MSLRSDILLLSYHRICGLQTWKNVIQSNAGGVTRSVREGGTIMEKIRLGRTGLLVTKTAFGALPIQRISKADAVKLVRRGL